MERLRERVMEESEYRGITASIESMKCYRIDIIFDVNFEKRTLIVMLRKRKLEMNLFYNLHIFIACRSYLCWGIFEADPIISVKITEMLKSFEHR